MTELNAVSLFSGIGGIDAGLERHGIRTRVQVEWDVAASRVLAHHWPDVTRFGDVREVTAQHVRDAVRDAWIDLLSFGFPCQDLSVAGRRAGVADGTRSGLYREGIRLAEGLAPDWLVVENVPGLLSADDGRAFALVLGDLTGWEPAVPADGWRNSGVCVGPHRSAAWRVLDAQHFGVAQRRRRVFIVCHAGDRAAPAAVLLECEGVRGNPPAGWPSWQRTASGVVCGALHGRGAAADSARAAGVLADGDLVTSLTQGLGTGGPDAAHAQAGWLVPVGALTARHGKGANSNATDALCVTGDVTHALTSEGADASEDDTGRGTPIIGFSHTQGKVESFAENQRGEVRIADVVGAASTGGGKPGQGYQAVRVASAVRRLTPRECERLQGFPDDWTLIPGTSDSARYRQLGNAVCVNVAEWVGWRIRAYQDGWRP